MNMTLLTFGLVAFVLSTIVLLMLLLVFNLEMLIINIKYIAANELNSLIRLVNQNGFDDMGYKFAALPTDQQIETNPLDALYQLLDVAKQRDSTKQAAVEIPLADELKPSERNTAEFY